MYKWAEKARRGSQRIYYTGDLAFARFNGNAPREADDAWHLMTRKVVRLMQRRISRMTFEYIAVRT